MSPYEYLRNHVVSIIKPSPIGGVGLFAVRDIKEGESLFEVWPNESGIYHITHDELHTLPEDLKKERISIKISCFLNFRSKQIFSSIFLNTLLKYLYI